MKHDGWVNEWECEYAGVLYTVLEVKFYNKNLGYGDDIWWMWDDSVAGRYPINIILMVVLVEC